MNKYTQGTTHILLILDIFLSFYFVVEKVNSARKFLPGKVCPLSLLDGKTIQIIRLQQAGTCSHFTEPTGGGGCDVSVGLCRGQQILGRLSRSFKVYIQQLRLLRLMSHGCRYSCRSKLICIKRYQASLPREAICLCFHGFSILISGCGAVPPKES